MRWICSILALLVLGSVSGGAIAQSFPSDRAVQAMMDERVAQKKVTGIVLVTYDPAAGSKIFTAGSSGRAALQLDGETLFEIGSITKTFTAALLAEMTARGEVKLDDAVAIHLPPGIRVPSRGGRQITLADLATHTSGLPALPANINPKDIANPYSDYSVAMLDQFLAGYELPRDVGTQYEYSAVGLGLLGRALGYRLGKDWEAALVERVLAPLGMDSTRATLDANMLRRLAPGHDGAGHETLNWDIPALPAMGALRSSANDLLRFLVANIDRSSQPLGAALAMTHVPRTVMDEETRVGLAWQIGHATNRTMVWHGGGTGGYRSLIAFEPETQRGVIVLSNSANGADDLGFHVLDPSLPLE